MRCIHCECLLPPTPGTNKCPNCDEYPFKKKEGEEKILRTKEEKEGRKKIRKMDKL